jgi:hypothetical protein
MERRKRRGFARGLAATKLFTHRLRLFRCVNATAQFSFCNPPRDELNPTHFKKQQRIPLRWCRGTTCISVSERLLQCGRITNTNVNTFWANFSRRCTSLLWVGGRCQNFPKHLFMQRTLTCGSSFLLQYIRQRKILSRKKERAGLS